MSLRDFFRKRRQGLLMNAIETADIEKVRTLLTQGAAINETIQREDGRTPLLLAAVKGHAQIVRLLIDSGADVSQKNIYGKTALDCAESAGRAEVVQVFREHFQRLEREAAEKARAEAAVEEAWLSKCAVLQKPLPLPKKIRFRSAP